ncbi:MAG: hypothetical protein ACRD11_01390 [Terriglobia bacterium]
MFRQRFLKAAPLASRWAIALATLIIAASSSCALLAQVKHQRGLELIPQKANKVTYGLTLVTPSEANFDRVVEIYFQGLPGFSDYQGVRPYLALLRNDSAVPAVGYEIQWRVLYRDGHAQTFNNTFVLRPLTRTVNVTLLPQSVRLIFPKLTFTPAEYQVIPDRGDQFAVSRLISSAINLTPREYQDTSNFAEQISASRFLSSAGLVSGSPEVVGVVYRDGTYAGPEGIQVWRRYVTARLAARDEALYVLDLLNSSAPVEKVYTALDRQTERELLDQGTDTTDMYVRNRGRSADYVESLLQRDGADETLKILARIAGPSKSFTVFGKRY